ncbi:MAG: hypothetical protein B6D59_02980 [Campylobacteraceae bacterium 4484_4]|nr:MAG: hypothetical protein B6D59_02980 [Campylobacteraceae bacterium 4484_4]
MRIVALLFLSLHLLYGANVVNYNLYERENRLDLMLSFDDAYKGRITKRTEGVHTILQLEGATLSQKIIKHPRVSFVKELRLVPYVNRLLIEIAASDEVKITASKTIDRYGLRIRITPVYPSSTKGGQEQKAVENPLFTAPEKKEKPQHASGIQKSVSIKKDSGMEGAYLKMIAVLVGLLLFLYLLKKIMNTGRPEKSWLFPVGKKEKSPVHIVYQKSLDARNRVALIGYKGYLYLVLLGVNNVLLDKFREDHAPDEEEFEELLQKNSDKLDQFIRLKNEKLNAYKEKVGREFSKLH